MSVGLKLWEAGGAIHARLSVPLRSGGSISVHTMIHSSTILKVLKDAGVQLQPRQGATPEQVGSFFGSIGKALKKISKISIIKKALSIGKALINSPLTSFIAPCSCRFPCWLR